MLVLIMALTAQLILRGLNLGSDHCAKSPKLTPAKESNGANHI